MNARRAALGCGLTVVLGLWFVGAAAAEAPTRHNIVLPKAPCLKPGQEIDVGIRAGRRWGILNKFTASVSSGGRTNKRVLGTVRLSPNGNDVIVNATVRVPRTARRRARVSGELFSIEAAEGIITRSRSYKVSTTCKVKKKKKKKRKKTEKPPTNRPAPFEYARLDPQLFDPRGAMSDEGVAHIVWEVRPPVPGGSPGAAGSAIRYCRIPRGAKRCDIERTFAVTPTVCCTSQWDVFVRDEEVMITAEEQGGVFTLGLIRLPQELHVLTSQDGGSTFSRTTTNVSDGMRLDGTAIRGPGEFSVSYLRDEPSDAEFSAVPIESGEAPPRSTTLAQGVRDSDLALLDPTTPIVSYARPGRGIFVRRWSGSGNLNEGPSWLPEQLVDAGNSGGHPGGTNANPRLTDGTKGLFLGYQRGDGKLVTRRFAGGGFGRGLRVTRDAGPRPENLEQDIGGNLYAHWYTNERFDPEDDRSKRKYNRYAYSRDGGKTWEAQTSVFNNGAGIGVVDGPLLASSRRALLLLPNRDGRLTAVDLPTPGGGSGAVNECRTEPLKVAQATILPREGCLRKKEKGVYYADGAIRINGMDIDPKGGKIARAAASAGKVGPIKIDPAARSVTSSVGALVTSGSVMLDDVPLKWRIPKNKGGKLEELASGDPLMLNAGKFRQTLLDLDVRGRVLPSLSRGAASLPLNLKIPSPIGGLAGGPLTDDAITLKTSNAIKQGLSLKKGNVVIDVGKVYLGPAYIDPFKISYLSDPNEFKGDLGVFLPVSGGRLGGSFLFRQGSFVDATAFYEPLKPGIPIASTSLFLTRVDLHVHKLTACNDPTFLAIGGSVTAAGGLVRVDGKVQFDFPEASCNLPAVFRIGGHGYLAELPVAKFDVTYTTPARIDLHGEFGIGDANAGASLVIDGKIGFNKPSFYAGGTATIHALNFEPATVKAVFSSVGLGACVTLASILPGAAEVNAGFTYRYGDSDPEIYVFSCNLDRLVPASLARSSQAGGAVSFDVPKNQSLAGIVLHGPRGAAPVAELVAPDGTRYSSPTPSAPTRKDARYQALLVKSTGDTSFGIRKPRGGRWTAIPAPGSRITGVETARGIPDPKVVARVSRGRRGARALRYRVRQVPGQVVTFVERGRRTERIIGGAKGAAGQLTFRPGAGLRERRQIIALVNQRGIPRAQLRVASFRAPGSAPGKPRRVRLHRRRGGLVVSWRGTRNAREYAVEVNLRDGRRLLIPAGRRTRSVGVPSVPRNDSGRIQVAAVGVDGRPGPFAKATLRQAKPRCRRVRVKRRGQRRARTVRRCKRR